MVWRLGGKAVTTSPSLIALTSCSAPLALSAIWFGTAALLAGSSGAIFSLAVAEVFFLTTLACLATTVSDSDEELNSPVEKLAATLGPLLEELRSPREALELPCFFLAMPGILSLATASRGPFTRALLAIWSGTTAVLAGLSGTIFFVAVAKVFFLATLAILAAAASLALRLMSALASGLSDFLGVSVLATPGVSSATTLARCAATATCSDEKLAITHDMSA